MPKLDLQFNFIHLTVKFFEVSEQPVDELAEHTGQFTGCILNEFRDTTGDIANALRHDQAVFSHQAPYLIGLRGTRLHEPLASPV